MLKFMPMLSRSHAQSASALSFLLLASIAVLGQVSQSENKISDPIASGENVPVLVELFTSEGCSSCPPADIILKRLDEFQPIPGAQLIVLSEHVTYWDQLGWKDPNSSAAFTDRQNSYESALGEREVYTPQFVVDGTQSVSLEELQALEDALNKAKGDPKIPLTIGDVKIDPSDPTTMRARLEVGANPERHNVDVYVALALNHVESKVLRGENGGKQLVHVAVVQQLTRVGKLSKGKSFAPDIQLKLKQGEEFKNLRLVAFAQESGPGKIIGAAIWKPAN
ncbi:MAG TPA: DUF1223 domain-containing protein [Candidatus Eisenbacteria bacterium]|nr:DUF1223 domain-containing protein [Candidatus Eisenbacteria bacterium]